MPNRHILTWDHNHPTGPADCSPADTPGKNLEPARANTALGDYCFLGPSRSLEKLHRKYQLDPAPPTRKFSTIKTWCQLYAWSTRAFAFDQLQREKENTAYEDQRRQLIKNGLALNHERVEKLKHAYDILEPFINNPEYIFTRHVKRIPAPDGTFELVETRTFNAEIFTQFRGLLADIARETIKTTAPETPANPFDLSRITQQELLILEKLFTRRPSP